MTDFADHNKLNPDEHQVWHDNVVARLTAEAHPSHNFGFDDDTVHCVDCGLPAYSSQATLLCTRSATDNV